MPRDGCRECLYRRIICDKTDPSCKKCLRKGIECSGVGKFCFVAGASRRRRKAAPSSEHSAGDLGSILGSVAPDSWQLHNDGCLKDVVGANSLMTELEQSDLDSQRSDQQHSVLSGKNSISPQRSLQTYQPYDMMADLVLASLKPGISELLMNCKSCDHLIRYIPSVL